MSNTPHLCQSLADLGKVANVLQIINDDNLFEALQLDSAGNICDAISEMLGGMKSEKIIKSMQRLGLGADEIRGKFIDMGIDGGEALEKLDTSGTKSAGKLEAAFKGALAKIGAFFKSTPGMITIAIASITALASAYNYFATASDRAMEAHQEAVAKYEETNAEIETLETSLDAAKKKLEELNSTDSAELVNPNEITKLESSIALMKKQLEIKRKLAAFEAQEAAKAAANTLNARNLYVTGVTVSDGVETPTFGTRTILDEAETYKQDIARLANSISAEWDKLDSLDEGTDAYEKQEEKIRGLEQQKLNLEESFLEIQQQVLELYGTLTDADGAALSSYEGMVGRIESVFDLYHDTLEETKSTVESTTTQSISKAEALRDSMQKLWNSDAFAESRGELVKLSKTLDGITAKDVEDLAKEGCVLADALEEDGISAEFLAYCLQEVAEGKDGFAAITEGALDLGDALEGAAGMFDKVTEARKRYNDALSVEEKDAGFQTYAGALEKIKEEIASGTTNSNTFWAAAELLFGEDQLKAWDFNVDAIKSGVNDIASVFGNADSAGADFLDKLYAMSEAGVILGENGEQIAEISKNAAGGFDFAIDTDSIDDLAQKMGMSEEAVLACIEALSMYCDIDLYNLDEIITATEELGIMMDASGQKVMNYQQLVEHLEAHGVNAKGINDITDDLAKQDIVLLDMTDDINTLITSFQDLGFITQDGITMEVDYVQLATFLATIGFTRTEVEALTERLLGLNEITLDAAGKKVSAVEDNLEDTVNASLILNEIDFRDPEQGLHDISDAIADIDGSDVSNITSSFEAYNSTLSKVLSKLNRIYEKQVLVNSGIGDIGSHENSAYWSKGYATGTKHAKAGPALLGDEYSPTGTPKPELVVSGNKAYLAGVDGPTVGYLRDGDVVYTASETKKILRGSFSGYSGSIPAYARGIGSRQLTSNVTLDGGPSGASVSTRPPTTQLKRDELARRAYAEIKGDNAYWKLLYNKAINILINKLVGGAEADTLSLSVEDFDRQFGRQDNYDRLLAMNSVPGTWELFTDEIFSKYADFVYKTAWQWSNGTCDVPSDFDKNANPIVASSSYRSDVYSPDSQFAGSTGDIPSGGGAANGGAGGGGGGSSSSTEKSEFQKAYEEHKHNRAMEKETDEEYLSWLEGAYKDAYEKGEIALEDFRKYEEEVFELQKDIFQDHLSDLEHQIEGMTREGGKDKEIIALYEQMISDIEKEIADAKARGLDDNSEYIQDLTSQIWDYQDEIADIQEELAESAKDAVEDLIDYRIDMIKSELESEKDALSDRLDEYKEFCDKQKTLLQDQYDHEKRLDEQKEKRKARSDIQEELNALRFDDSAWAQKRKLELQAELADADKDLKDFERDNALKEAQALLDKAYEKQEIAINSQIESIEARLNDPEALYNRALNDIRNNTAELYYAMIDFNNANGSGNPDEIREMWDEAYVSLNNYMALYGEAYKDIMLVASSTSIESGGYASGTSHALPGFRRVNEVGAEDIFVRANGDKYRMFSGGEKVLNAKATEFLYKFATSGGRMLPDIFGNIVSKMRSVLFDNFNSAPQVIEVNAGDIIVQGNATEKTVSEIRRAQREGIDYILKEFGRLNR